MLDLSISEPTSLTEALDLLGADEAARPVGGATAIMLMMKAQLFRPKHLVSLRKLGDRFRGIDFDPGRQVMRVGAMTTFAELEHHSVVGRVFPIITKAMVTLANPRVRHVASVGGNLAHADPHLDLPPIWLALDAEIGLVGPSGERRISARDLFAGYYETTLRPGELIADVTVPVRTGWRSTYVKITTRSAHDWPAVSIAVAIRPEDGRCGDARLVLSAATDRPLRLDAAEAVLVGSAFDDAAIAETCEAAAGMANILSDDRGSSDYKSHLLRVHLARTLQQLVSGCDD